MNQKKRTLWLLADGNAIGGAETRMIKIASRLKEASNFYVIKIVVTPELYNNYKNHKSLKHQINESLFEFVVYKNQISAYWKIISYLEEFFSLNLKKVKEKILIKKSWYPFLRKRVSTGDVIHCYMGDNARNGAFFYSMNHNNTVLLEITNHRYIKRVVSQFKLINNNRQRHHACYIRSVSEKVHDNFLKRFDDKWFANRNIDLDYYSGPFIEFKKNNEIIEKENIIVFPHRFVKPKNGVLFSTVVKDLMEQNKLDGWKILFRGAGSDENEIKNNLREWIDSGQVNVGYSHNLFTELKKSKIAVSLIETGSYPSQSVFESLQAGCALLISKSGNSEKELNHPAIYYTDLSKEEIMKNLMILVDKNNEELKNIQQEMVKYYQWFIEHRNQLKDIFNLYELNH